MENQENLGENLPIAGVQIDALGAPVIAPVVQLPPPRSPLLSKRIEELALAPPVR